MPTSMRVPAISPKGNPVDLTEVRQDKRLVLRGFVRAAIDESGWKHEAVAAAISEATGRSIDGPYLSKMLAGEKPMTDEVIEGLPDDIEAIVARLYAESFGQVVVAPVTGDDAIRSLVSGLVGMLRPQLPERASGMAKAALPLAAAVRKVGR